MPSVVVWTEARKQENRAAPRSEREKLIHMINKTKQKREDVVRKSTRWYSIHKASPVDYRCGFAPPFMRCDEDVGGVGTLPFVFPPVDGLGTLAALVEARGNPSFCTIFAWISSSLEALTCFGQNNVTNLSDNSQSELHNDRPGWRWRRDRWG